MRYLRNRGGRSFLLVVVLALGGLACAPAPKEEPVPEAPEAMASFDRTQLWNFITTGNPDGNQPVGVLPSDPFYNGWPLFPAGPGGDPEEFLNKRLGLATHGRWVTVRVNPVAYQNLQSYEQTVATGGGKIPRADLPVGSIIVKVNINNVNKPGIIQEADVPSSLTVLYKPAGDLCQGGFKFNGVDCLGNGWLWAFYGIDTPQLPRDIFDQFIAKNPEGFCFNCHDPGFQQDYLRSLETIARTLAAEQQPTRDARLPPPVNDEDPFCKDPRLSPVVPTDVAFEPSSLPADQRQRLFDCFSWKTFVALNWPAEKGAEGRGKADTSVGFGDFSDEREAVWETYKQTYELFQPDDPNWDPQGTSAGTFQSQRPIPDVCPADTDLPVLSMITKTNSRFPDEQDVANEAGQAFAGSFGTLTDRNGRLARYQVLFNETEFAFLVPSAATRNLTPSGPNGGVDTFFPDGATEVKAAWKELCTAEQKKQGECTLQDLTEAYFHRDVLVYEAADPQRGTKTSCRRMTLGLVGLHIAVKTFWAPQWIWATFEFKYNVPPFGESGEGYAFFDPACKTGQKDFLIKACSAQPFLAPKVNQSGTLIGDPCCPNVPLNRWPEIGFGSHPNQLTRLVPVGGSGLNDVFPQLMATKAPAFGNYILVNTQWPLHGRRPVPEGQPNPVNTRLCESQRDASADPLRGDDGSKKDPDCFTMVPEFLRNTVIESYMSTYVQNDAGEVQQVSNRSCMGCHFSGTDFSYIWADAVEQRVPVAGGGS